MSQEPIKRTIKQQIPALPKKPAPPASASLPSQPAVPSKEARKQPAAPEVGEDAARPFRPLFRPPIAILEMTDDGADEGELVRIRGDAITIGRSNADVVIPHDPQISGNHARLSRRLVEGAYQWFLTDLDSTNGTFVRVAKVILNEGQLVLLGSHRYLFRAAQVDLLPDEPADAARNATQGWQKVSAADLSRLTPTLVRLNPDGTEYSHRLNRDLLVIGRSSDSCQLVFNDDPAVSTVHARLRRAQDGRFVLEDANSRNGVWLGIHEQRLHKSSQFQLGEQRFRLRLPS